MEQRKYRVGISGSYGGLNLGDEAILQCIIAELRKSLPVEITVFSRNAEDTQSRHKVDKAIPVRELALNEIKPEIENLDLFVLGGGGLLYDSDVSLYLREVKLAQQCNIPVMTYAIGVGPLKDPSMQKLVKEVLNQVDMITVREKEAQRVLENLGVTQEILVTADPALLMQPEPLSDELLIRENIADKKNLIGMSVREPGGAAPDIDDQDYHALLANAADFIVDRLGAEVLFIPMERKEKDLQHAHSVIAQMLQPDKASILKEEYTSGQMLSIIGKMNFAVGMRLHFLIFAALQNVPFVSLPYAAKVMGFLDSMDLQMPPIHKVGSGRLAAHIDYSWDQQDFLRNKISQKLPALKEKASETNQHLMRLLSEKYDLVKL